MEKLTRHWLEVTQAFCGMPTTLTNKHFFYSNAPNVELDFRQKFVPDEGMSLISVKILESKKSNLNINHLELIGK